MLPLLHAAPLAAVCLTRVWRLLAAEYVSEGHVSEKLDIYSYAVVLLELLTSRPSIELVRLHCDGPELFTEMPRFMDARAGAWPARVVSDLGGLAQQCISYHARERPAAVAVVARLEAVLEATTQRPALR